MPRVVPLTSALIRYERRVAVYAVVERRGGGAGGLTPPPNVQESVQILEI